ncbi:MAG: metallophosphoesterase family protein [Anaerolineae bacterium]
MIAFFSDIHGNKSALAAAIEDARRRGAQRFVCLGDIGGSECLDLLREVRAECVFGNWEVSGWHRYAVRHHEWVCSWPPVLYDTSWVAAHASPSWPSEVQNVTEAASYRARHHLPWLSLFPALDVDESARWDALAVLETLSVPIGLHGHTHIQAIWHWRPDGRLIARQESEVPISDDGSRYLVGVGSVGDPRDGDGICYALLDDSLVLRLIRLPSASKP